MFHQADATADRLERRFGHPSLHQPLISPMLHKNVEHLLPLVFVLTPPQMIETEIVEHDRYKGRIEESVAKTGEGTIDATAGGLKFQMLETRDLSYDRATYLRQRYEDAMSTSPSLALNRAKPLPSFDDPRRTTCPASFAQRSSIRSESYELEMMLPRQSFDSSQALLRPGIRDRSSSGSYTTQPSSSRPSVDYRYSPVAFETESVYPARLSPPFLAPDNRSSSRISLPPPLVQPRRRLDQSPPLIDRPAAPRRHRYSEGDVRGAESRF